MKHIKHWLATMAVLLCSVTASAHDFEVGGIYYKIIFSSDFTVEVTFRGTDFEQYSDEYGGAVIIPSEVTYNGETYDVTSIGRSAFRDCSSLTTVTIPESMTSIGDYAFYYCRSLTSITLPESVTNIGAYAFQYCHSLTSITLPESVTSIGRSVFQSCSSLAAITIPESVTSIGESAFSGCRSLTAITIPESVTSIGDGAFSGCSSLTAIVVAEGNKVYDSRNGCNAIIETNSNTLINGCATTIIPESVTSIGFAAFSNCSSLTSITIPESVTIIGDFAFQYCHSLTSINIPEGVTSIGDDVFCECHNLASITIPESVTSIGDEAFYYCRSLTSITLPESVTSIGNHAFDGCRSLTSITLPESVTSIGDWVFSYCSSLTSITCEAVNPPTTQYGTFNGVNKSIPIYVPKKSISAYQSASYWKNFSIRAIPTPENITLPIGQYGSGTYCSEYALDFSEVEGLKAYAATGYDTETGVVTLSRVMTAKAGVGLFIKGEPGDYVVPVLESTSFNTLNMLVGTSEEVTLGRTSEDGLYVNYKYTLSGDNATPQFYVFDDGFTLGAGKAYLQVPAAWVQTEARSISLRFDDGETTDIEEPELKIENSTVIFDLMGRRVVNPVKGGVYVVNGKKVIY